MRKLSFVFLVLGLMAVNVMPVLAEDMSAQDLLKSSGITEEAAIALEQEALGNTEMAVEAVVSDMTSDAVSSEVLSSDSAAVIADSSAEVVDSAVEAMDSAVEDAQQ